MAKCDDNVFGTLGYTIDILIIKYIIYLLNSLLIQKLLEEIFNTIHFRNPSLANISFSLKTIINTSADYAYLVLHYTPSIPIEKSMNSSIAFSIVVYLVGLQFLHHLL